VSTFPTLIQHSPGISSQGNKARERHKRNSNREGRNQVTSICRGYNLICLKDPKYSTKKLDMMNTFGNVAGYKVNIQESVAFPCNNNCTKKEIKKKISLIKYLGIKLASR
jgi:hypothetical protein